MLNQLKLELEAKKKWKIMGIDQVKANGAYSAIFAKKMHNWKNKIAPKEDFQFLIVDGILDDETGKNLSREERDVLMQSLNVDALAFVKVDVQLKSPLGKLNGIGSRKPSATTYLVVHSKGKEYPIWEAWHEVNEPEESIALTDRGLDQQTMNTISIASAKKSFAELLTTLKVEKR